MRLPSDIWVTDRAYVIDSGEVVYKMVKRNADWTLFRDIKTFRPVTAFRHEKTVIDAVAKAKWIAQRRKERGL